MLRTTAHFEWDFTYVLMSAQPTNQSISRGLVKASVIPYRNTGDASAEHRLHLCGQSAPDNHFAAEETGSSASAIISAPPPTLPRSRPYLLLYCLFSPFRLVTQRTQRGINGQSPSVCLQTNNQTKPNQTKQAAAAAAAASSAVGSRLPVANSSSTISLQSINLETTTVYVRTS